MCRLHYESGWALGVGGDDIFSVRCCLKEKLDAQRQFWVTLAVIWIYSDGSQMQMVNQFSVYCEMTIKNSLAGTLATTNMIQSFGELSGNMILTYPTAPPSSSFQLFPEVKHERKLNKMFFFIRFLNHLWKCFHSDLCSFFLRGNPSDSFLKDGPFVQLFLAAG